MSIIIVDVKSRVPIYEQIISSVKSSVIDGLFLPDEPLPSVRTLAGELAINPNTIQKAYSELERQGIVYSVPGKGSFVSSDTAKIEAAHKKEIAKKLSELIAEAFKCGFSIDDILWLAKTGKEQTNDTN